LPPEQQVGSSNLSGRTNNLTITSCSYTRNTS
jgi:hypothetical protein